VAKLVSFKTPDGTVHENLCIIVSDLVISHGSKLVSTTDKNGTNWAREFKFTAKAQGFHTKEDAELGRPGVPGASFSAEGTNVNYFVQAAKTLYDIGLCPDKASPEVTAFCKATTFADVIDAGAWSAILAQNTNLKDATSITLGDCVFTNPAKSRLLPKE
jgi:hypothetical protein